MLHSGKFAMSVGDVANNIVMALKQEVDFYMDDT